MQAPLFTSPSSSLLTLNTTSEHRTIPSSATTQLESTITDPFPALNGTTQIDSAVYEFMEENRKALLVVVTRGRRTFQQAEVTRPLQKLIRVKTWKKCYWEKKMNAVLNTKDGSISRLSWSVYKGDKHYTPLSRRPTPLHSQKTRLMC